MAVQAKRAKDDHRWNAENAARQAKNIGRKSLESALEEVRGKEFSELNNQERDLLLEYIGVKLGILKPPAV